MTHAMHNEPLRILVATDLTPQSRPHLRLAARIADAIKGHLTLFHAVLPVPLLVDAPLAPDRTGVEHVDEARADIRVAASTLQSWRPVHAVVEEAGSARDATLLAAERLDADLIVLPTHGRTGVGRAVLGSVAEQILRRSTRPVLLLTDRMLDWQPAAGRAAGPLIVATDLSPDSVVAHRPAAELARRLGLPLLLLSVLPTHEPHAFVAGAPTRLQEKSADERTHERVRDLQRHAVELGGEVPVEVLAHVADDVAAAIVGEAAKQEGEMLVLTTHGRRGVARLIRGSVAEQVVRQATMPVLVMPVPKQ